MLQRLVVCLEESLHIHNIRDMKILHTIRDTPPNPRGLCALSPSVERCLLAYPGSSAVGEVQIFDAVHLHAKCVLSAHDSPLAALAWSLCGRRLATASERGTVIRVFAVPERTRLYEFRRGVKRCVSIACLAFSACGAYLAATSNTETVHVFKLTEGAAAADEGGAGAAAADAPPADDDAPAGWIEWLSRGLQAGKGYLPQHVADVLAQGRAFASARLPHVGYRARAAITRCAPPAPPRPGAARPPADPAPCCVAACPARRGCWSRRRRACCTCTRWTRPRAASARCCARTTSWRPRRTPRPPTWQVRPHPAPTPPAAAPPACRSPRDD